MVDGKFACRGYTPFHNQFNNLTHGISKTKITTSRSAAKRDLFIAASLSSVGENRDPKKKREGKLNRNHAIV